jgi:hypothetical protein
MAAEIYRIELPISLYECPRYWVNFIEDCKHTDSHRLSHRINQVLEEFSGSFYYEEDLWTGVEFRTIEDALYFKLKWA